MNQNPKVSILVPVYGVEKFIERCAISLFEQTFEDIEYVFVNDCTPDKSIDILKEVLEKYPDRKAQVKIINHEVNKGLAGARNTGVENANGDYILHVDSDDYLEVNAIELLYKKAISDNADIVVCDYIFEWSNYKEIFNINVGDDNVKFIQCILSSKLMIGVVNKLIRKTLYTENNIKAIEGINLGEDLMTIPKLIYYSKKVFKLNSALYHYSQINPNSYTTQKLSKNNIDNLIFVLNDLTSFFENKPDNYIYNEALLQGKLRKKMDMLFFVDKEYLVELNALFPETDNLKDINFLLSRDKISYPLLKRNYIGLFLIYRNIYKILFNIKNNLVKK